jgi:S1-C subfamily serine protease
MSHIAAESESPTGRSRGAATRRTLGALLALGCLMGPTSARGQGLNKAVLDRAKDATVYVKIKVNGQPVSAGSGFVIKVLGDTVLVLTNRHVAVDDDELPAGAKREIFVVFRSQTAQEQELPAKLLTFDHRQAPDLAMLEVKGVRMPLAEISADRTAKESDFYETMPAYSLGFPFSAGIIGAKDVNFNPAVTVNAISISAFRRGESGRLERIQYAGSAIGGNSGGPIINDKGLLVGVVVERVLGENVGRAIPPNVVAGFLGGDVDIIFGGLMAWSGNTARYAIGGRMVDPMGKIRSMSARYVLQSAVPTPLKPDAQGHYPILPNSKVVPLEKRPASSIRNLPIADAAGYAEIDIPITTPSDRKLYFQVVVTDSFGRNYGNKPVMTTIPDKPENVLRDLDQDGGRDSNSPTLAQWSCQANLADGIKMKHEPGLTSISLPGGVPISNSPQYDLFNAPCALVRVDGDFVALVEVLNSFDPGSEGVVLPSGKKFPTSFQSTGLLIWQDEKNFIRLERSKRSDGRIGILNQVLVEVYKNGKEVASHYIDVPEVPIALLAVRQGGSVRLLFAMLTGEEKVDYRLFHEMAVDYNNEVFVGLAAANLSKRAFQAKLKGFVLQTPEKIPIAVKPFKMNKLVDLGIQKLPDGTTIIEGAAMRVSTPHDAPVTQQTNMAEFKGGQWSDDRQLLWNNDKAASTLTLELPVETTAKYEIKAKFTQAPDYAIVKLEVDNKPLFKDQKIDFYSQEIKSTKLISLGTVSLSKGKRKLTITVFNKNPKSSGFHFGLDEIQLIPAK